MSKHDKPKREKVVFHNFEPVSEREKKRTQRILEEHQKQVLREQWKGGNRE